MTDNKVSIIDSAPRQSKQYDPRRKRHPLCRAFDIFLESILQDQKNDKCNVAEAMRHEFGESLTASIMQAAEIRRMRKEIGYEPTSSQVATQAPDFTGASG